MKEIPLSVKKAFAIASCVGAVLKTSDSGIPKLLVLKMQINKSMKVFNLKAGNKSYWQIANGIQEVWKDLNAEYNYMLTDEEASVFIAMICNLITPKDFKDFLGVKPFKSFYEIPDELEEKMKKSVQDLDRRLNDLFGTTSCAIIEEKENTPKEKKERDKSKKSQTKRKNQFRWLKEKARKARQRNENEVS